MATEKILSTRIQLKVDTLTNWSGSSLILKKGEVAFATTAATAGTGLSEPVVMIKIGDGEHTFAQLPYNFYAKASDVLEVAKDSVKLTAFVNGVIADAGIASNETVAQLGKDIEAVEAEITTLKGAADVEGSIAKRIADALANVNVADTAVTGQYVSEVSQVGGKISVKRVDLPTYTLASGSANGTVAFNGADVAVTGLGSAAYENVGAFEKSGEAAKVSQALETYKTSNDAAVAAAQAQANKGVNDAAAALAKANEKTTMAEVEAKDYATKAQAQGYADAKDEAIAAAKKAGDDAQADLDTYKGQMDTALAGKVDSTTYTQDKADLEEAIQANADAITLLTDGVDQEKVDGVKDLIDYVEEHQADFAGVLADVDAAEKAIAAETTRATGAEQAIEQKADANAQNITKIIDGTTPVAKAAAADTATNADKATTADQLGGVAADQYALKSYAEDQATTKASAAQTAAQNYADGLAVNYATATQGAKADTAVQPAALESYYTKTEADAEFLNDTEVTAKITALNLASTYEPIGAETRAKAYAESLASNYATAAQGAKADSALQEIKAGEGLKITGDKKDTVEIDTDVVFVFNCGTSAE